MNAWTTTLVEDWLIESALVEMSLPFPKLNGLQRPFISFMWFKDHREKWEEMNAQSQLRHEEKIYGRKEWAWGNPKAKIDPSAITRHEELLFLVAEHLPKRRGRLRCGEMAACMWAWAFSMAGGRTSFRRWCRKTGRKPSTAIRIKNHAVEHLTQNFSTVPQKKFLTEVEQIRQKWGANQIGLRNPSSPQAIVLEYPTKSDYSDPQVIQALEKSIRRANRRARRMKRRRK